MSEYEVQAALDGYILTKMEGTTGDFKASKLGEVTIEVRSRWWYRTLRESLIKSKVLFAFDKIGSVLTGFGVNSFQHDFSYLFMKPKV